MESVRLVSINDFEGTYNNDSRELIKEHIGTYNIVSDVSHNQYLFEVLEVLYTSGFLNVSAFPFTSNTQIIQYQCVGPNCSLMSLGITYLNSRAHGVIANRRGLYDYKYITDKSHPMPVVYENDFNLERVLKWTELIYGFSNCNLLYIDDDILTLDTSIIPKALKTDDCPYIETATPLPHQGSLIYKNPKNTREIYNIAKHFEKMALIRPALAGGSWYLLATHLRSKPMEVQNGISKINQYYEQVKDTVMDIDMDINTVLNIPYTGVYGFV